MLCCLVGVVGAPDALAVPLPRAVDEVLNHAALDGASVSLVLLDADGEVRYEYDADRRLVPASVTKWVTASAAARDLDLDFTFATRVAATGYLRDDTLVGDLVVIGEGDPSLGDGDWRGAVDRIVQTALASGIGRIEGQVVIDTRYGSGPPFGPGWMWDDMKESYSAPYGAVNFAHNVLQRGLNCPAQDGAGSPLLDPPTCLGQTLRAALVTAGVKVSGPAVVEARPEAVEIGVIRSAPLWMMLRHMLSTSDNLYAECIGRALDRGWPAEDTVARDRVGALLGDVGVAAGEVRLVDGSGLSRYSLVSARSLATLTWWGRRQPWGATLTSLLPVAGRSGTLANRLVGTPAEGTLRAKTGSMSGVRNMVGTLQNQDGEELVFAFLINGFTAPQSDVIAVQDRVLALIASSRRSGGIPAEVLEPQTGAGVASGG